MPNCNNCKHWESGNGDVGQQSGCISEHLYNKNGEPIEERVNKIEDIIAQDLSCPHFQATEDKGFSIVCKNCGFDECKQADEWDYNYDDEPYLLDSYFYCPNCGQASR